MQELFDTKVALKVVQNIDKGFKAEFKVDDFKFLVFMRADMIPQGHWEIIFFRVDGTSYDMNLLGDLNAKQTLTVFSGVKSAVMKWIGERDPVAFYFSAKEDEGSRVKLYDKFAKIMGKKLGYSLKKSSGSDGIKYTLTKV
jgi:hypothetical protein